MKAALRLQCSAAQEALAQETEFSICLLGVTASSQLAK